MMASSRATDRNVGWSPAWPPRICVETASDLARVIESCRSHQAIALGAVKAEFPESVAVTIPNRLDKYPGAITRSRKFIDYRPGVPAWCLIDFDSKGMPPEVDARINAAGRHVGARF